MTSSFQRLLLPLGKDIDQDNVLLPATVLANWFDASIQIACRSSAEVPDYEHLAAGLGVRVEPVVQLDGLTTEGLAAHASANEQTLIIVEATEFGLELAAKSSRPVFLAAGRPADDEDEDHARAKRRAAHRLPLGPLAVQVTGSEDDLDALALAAVVAPALEESIRLVVDIGSADESVSHEDGGQEDGLGARAAAAEQRLSTMGLNVGVDALRGHGLQPLVLVGRTRDCTAVILPKSRLDEDGLINGAKARGLNVLVAAMPDLEAGRPAPFTLDLSRPVAHAPDGADISELDPTECMARLGRHSVARIGYVDAGWPTVVPINYRYNQQDIFIRSLKGGKLGAAEREDVVCLELDGYDEQLRSGWSVLVHGRLEVIDDAATLRKAWDDDPGPWVASDQWSWLRLVPFSIGGREVEPGLANTQGTVSA